MTTKEDFVSIEEKIQKKIIKDRQEDYGDYQENFKSYTLYLLK